MMRRALQHCAHWLQALGGRQKRLILGFVDAVIGALLVGVLALVLPPLDLGLGLVVVAVTLAGLASILLGLNRTKLNTFMHTGILRAAVFAFALALGIATYLSGTRSPSAGDAGLLTAPLAFCGLVLSRAILLHLTLWLLGFRDAPLRVLIYGAGKTGQQLSAALRAHETILPIAFLDDNSELHGSSVAGLRIHGPSSITRLARRHRIDRVLLAMPSQPAAKLLRLSRRINAEGIDVHALPSFAQLVGTEALLDQLAPLDPDDVLGRSQLAWDLDNRAGVYRGRTIMVTGAGGSVGAQLCHQILNLRPKRLVLFDLSELALYTVHRDLGALPMAAGIDIVPILGSVCDARLVGGVLSDHTVDVIFHAAAYKHVPLVEANPLAGLTNNVIGTRVLAEAAQTAGIERFILISTDKAVRPTNVMGASKRLAELVVQDMAKRPGNTAFSLVRFGNVLGSSGSVIPLFRDQIAAGGPVTLTHDDVTRYFMSLSEAAQLVLFAGSLDKRHGGGEGGIFVLDMGDPIRIRDLAVQMVTAAGLTVREDANPDGDIDICVIGLRPGEKLHEELLTSTGMATTPHPKILCAMEPSIPAFDLAGTLQALQSAIDAGDADLARLVVEAAVQPRDFADNVTTIPFASRARA